ncbi:MAG: lyase family protein [Patescibacteria group bacterium]
MKAITLPEPSDQPNDAAIDPLDSRYYDPEVAKYLSEASRIAYQAYLEAALAHTLAEEGLCSQEIAEQIEQASQSITAREVRAEEETTRHDIKALVNCIKAKLDDKAKPYVHFGATSYDIIASAQALQLREAATQVVAPRLRELIKTLTAIADEHAETPQIGRTHGQHAVPITFGFAIAEYISRLGHTTVAIEALAGELVGKFSGAVGAYNALNIFVNDPIAFEQNVLAKVGLKPAEYSTQIVQPEPIIRLVDELAIAAGIMANLAHDMRNLQRTEIGETHERFEAGQTGSSTMAHKRNPWNFENVVSMSKQVTAQTINANLNISSEHQRDLTDSASSRFYPIALACVASMASRLNRIMSTLEVDSGAMFRNLQLTGGAIAAEPLYLLFEKYGHTAAHEKAKALAHKAMEDDKPLAVTVSADQEALAYWQKFTADEQKIIQNPEEHYTGLAAQKTRQIIDTWKNAL